jgi:hypothetical protein
MPGTALKSGDTLTVSCERKPQSAPERAGASDNRQRYPGGLITVATIAQASTIPLVEYYTPPLSDAVTAALQRELAQLRQSNQAMQATIQALGGRIQTLDAATSFMRPGGAACVIVPPGRCPAGWTSFGNMRVVQRAGQRTPLQAGDGAGGGMEWKVGDLCCGRDG